MKTKRPCIFLEFIRGRPLRIECDSKGKIIFKTRHEETIGLRVDDKFYYFNLELKKVTYCKLKNLTQIQEHFKDPPSNIHPKLKELYEEEIKKILNAKSDPEWFNVRFVYSRQTLKSKAEDDEEDFYFREGFYVMARKRLYFKNSSAELEEIPIQKNMVIEPYTEGEFPEGQEYMNEFFHRIANELEFEREEYERLKEKYSNL